MHELTEDVVIRNHHVDEVAKILVHLRVLFGGSKSASNGGLRLRLLQQLRERTVREIRPALVPHEVVQLAARCASRVEPIAQIKHDLVAKFIFTALIDDHANRVPLRRAAATLRLLANRFFNHFFNRLYHALLRRSQRRVGTLPQLVQRALIVNLEREADLELDVAMLPLRRPR